MLLNSDNHDSRNGYVACRQPAWRRGACVRRQMHGEAFLGDSA